MTDEELRAALGDLADEPFAVPPPSAEQRARHVDAMLRGAAPPAVRLRAKPRLLVVALVAMLVAAPAFGLWRASRPAALGSLHATGSALVLRGREASLVEDASPRDLHAGERVVTLAGATAVASIDGAIATLLPRGELSVAAAPGVSCELRAGRARFVVAKRGSRTPFVVRAADLDVVVRGTTFEVWIDPDGRAHVSVEEGRVGIVRAGEPEAELVPHHVFPAAASGGSSEPPATARPSVAPVDSPAPPPSSWPSSSPSLGRSAMPPSAGPLRTVPPLGGTGELHPSRVTPPLASSASTPTLPSQLREQNDLLWEAAEARRHGDFDRERRALEAFDRRFPNAPGSHDARAAALRRALASGDKAAAREAARAYLAAHPHGPLRAEALAVD